jgi:hypothetical protein
MKKILLMMVEDNMKKNEKNIVQLDHDKISTPHWSNGVQKTCALKKQLCTCAQICVVCMLNATLLDALLFIGCG